MEKRKEFYVCCLLCCFKTLPLNITAKLPATGFTAGQLIDLTLVADNQSSKNVKNFKVEFFKVGKMQMRPLVISRTFSTFFFSFFSFFFFVVGKLNVSADYHLQIKSIEFTSKS